MEKDYYSIIGVEPDADSEEIRRAYREKVRKCHPDACCEEDPEKFLELQEAYETLNDSIKRREYDVRLLRSRQRHQAHRHTSLMDTMWNDTSSEIQNMVDRYFNSMFDEIPVRGKRLELELILTREEARQGGTYEVELPLRRTCPACGGNQIHRFFCDCCEGMGKVHVKKKITLQVPHGICSGTELVLPLRVNNLEYKVHILVRVG